MASRAVRLRRLGTNTNTKISNNDDSETKYHFVVEAPKVIYGKEHARTLATMSQIAKVAAFEGDDNTAITMYEFIEDARERALGPENSGISQDFSKNLLWN